MLSVSGPSGKAARYRSTMLAAAFTFDWYSRKLIPLRIAARSALTTCRASAAGDDKPLGTGDDGGGAAGAAAGSGAPAVGTAAAAGGTSGAAGGADGGGGVGEP